MPKCDKCGNNLIEDNSGVDESDLSEGQLADFEAGFWRVFYCPKCKVTETLEGDFGHIDNAIPDEWEDEEFVDFDDVFDEKIVEGLIERAIKKRCFIEAISLIHNTVHYYLMIRVRNFLLTCDGEKFSYDSMIKELRCELAKQLQIPYHSFQLPLELCFLLDLIEYDTYEKICDFNKKRNKAIHELLTIEKVKDLEKEARKQLEKSEQDVFEAMRIMRKIDNVGDAYLDILEASKLGREIQMRLSSLGHPESVIKKTLEKFNLSEEEKAKDIYLRKG